ncbi:hypothetical protein A3Q56_07235 [Intoshia linei]|uniref:Uncharacterized protein n=1 Tax=Intoshia linei TaxID=1819745 RepID=A0A177AU68_9BILA|nr:hypothetical protein A3Q56_07235 [Intoshia linei]
MEKQPCCTEVQESKVSEATLWKIEKGVQCIMPVVIAINIKNPQPIVTSFASAFLCLHIYWYVDIVDDMYDKDEKFKKNH